MMSKLRVEGICVGSYVVWLFSLEILTYNVLFIIFHGCLSVIIDHWNSEATVYYIKHDCGSSGKWFEDKITLLNCYYEALLMAKKGYGICTCIYMYMYVDFRSFLNLEMLIFDDWQKSYEILKKKGNKEASQGQKGNHSMCYLPSPTN